MGTTDSTASIGLRNFFDLAPSVVMRDPLAEFLGAADGGLMEYRYADAVRLAGHSCPTVAGSFLMVLHSLRALYGDDTPVRGEVQVAMADSRDAGTTGVMATVAQLVTGAAPETGFGGIGGRFNRKDLLGYDAPVAGVLGLRRLDTGEGVQASLDTSIVPMGPEMQTLFPRAASGMGTPDECRRFGELWQDRVRYMLVEVPNDPRLVQIAPWA